MNLQAAQAMQKNKSRMLIFSLHDKKVRRAGAQVKVWGLQWAFLWLAASQQLLVPCTTLPDHLQLASGLTWARLGVFSSFSAGYALGWMYLKLSFDSSPCHRQLSRSAFVGAAWNPWEHTPCFSYLLLLALLLSCSPCSSPRISACSRRAGGEAGVVGLVE